MGRDWLRKIRNEKDMTHEEVATLVKISRQYYGMIESEVRDPGVSLAKRIGTVLGFDWTLFFKHKGNEMFPLGESRSKEVV
ncbi:helix-turn-helix transcriptional regulator [Paenibacillus dendritiformis]|uniref:helix-turn-helix transcriptional regulator n=2 Tax=Paenibacillus dendritiformis TaxID=130049 RepID=UPI001BCCAE88|nr:helix-turn-helix transcriptional regulator [Paenibacillus dendritiformis]